VRRFRNKGQRKGIYRIAPFAHIEGEWERKELLGWRKKKYILGRKTNSYEQEKSKNARLLVYLFV